MVGAAPPRIMGAMGAAQAAYGQAGLPAGAPAVELVAEITQPLKEPIIPPSLPPSRLLPPHHPLPLHLPTTFIEFASLYFLTVAAETETETCE